MSSISRMPREGLLYRDEGTPRAEKRPTWRTDQKIVVWMKDLVRKHGRRRDVMVDFCADKCFTAEVFILLQQHRKVLAHDVGSGILTAVKINFVLMFVSWVLSLKSDISGSGEVKAAAKVFKE